MKKKLHRNRTGHFFWVWASEKPTSAFNLFLVFQLHERNQEIIWSCSVASLDEVWSFWNFCPILVKTRIFPDNWFSTVVVLYEALTTRKIFEKCDFRAIWGPRISHTRAHTHHIHTPHTHTPHIHTHTTYPIAPTHARTHIHSYDGTLGYW